ncbi:MAG: nucleoside monophosphate kinase, partial [Candidatus Woesearchaeota archaeon]|nr:nucleoside monophosphate kinase [Candidatus Woesearchaeota archaeon]
GPPGVGKGTVGAGLQEKIQIPHLSSGTEIRREMTKKTKWGEKLSPHMNAGGNLVPDDVFVSYFKKKLEETQYKKGVILDGVIRTIPQAKMFEKEGIVADVVLFLNATENTIVDRAFHRLTCRNCEQTYNIKHIKPEKENICTKCGGVLYQREDDKPDQIKRRLIVYNEKTKSLVDFYKNQRKLVEIDASGTPKEIIKDILLKLKTFGVQPQ